LIFRLILYSLIPPKSNDLDSTHSSQRFKTVFEENDLFFSPAPVKDKENEDLNLDADPLRPGPATSKVSHK
jgi:hypothetical protein